MEILEIKSLQNDLVKFVVKLQNSKFRKSQKLILLDGIKTIEGLIDDNVEFEYFFALFDNPILKKVKAKKIITTTKEVLKKISTTSSFSKVVGVIKEPEIDKNIFKNFKKIALIDGIKDAGNLGTIIRSANAFGISGIILFNDCVDIYCPKTIRSSTQNMFKIPIIKTSDIEFIKSLKLNHQLISTVVNSSCGFCDCDFNENFIIAFGSEANGISKEILDISDKKVTISMENNVESLNLAICASISFAFIKAQEK